MNLYKAVSTDKANVQLQKTYTRLYVLLFTSSLGVLLFYNVVVERSIVKTYVSPSMADYEYLSNLYSDAANCPCSYLTIPYDTFLTELRVHAFHQACSTNAVSIVMIGGIYD